MQIDFHGAVRTVTGSQHLISVNGRKILLDCGLFQGSRKESYKRNQNLPFPASEVDVLVLSHAHIDHSGNIPNLVKSGFTGDIVCTYATRDLCAIMLRDSAKIQQYDLDYLNKKRKRRDLPPLQPIYNMSDVVESLKYFIGIGYERPYQIMPGVSLTFYDAGHILGSAIIALDIEDEAEKRHTRLVFSGDLGRPGRPILRDPTFIDSADILIIESTYGNREHANVEEASKKLETIVNKTCRRGGKVIVPAFAVGRSQELVYRLHKLVEARDIPPDLPIYVDSPLAIDATGIYRLHPEAYDEEVAQFLLEDRHNDPFGFDMMFYTRSTAQSKELNFLRTPAVIISASGMAEAGRILHHLKNNVENPQNTILIVGWQASATDDAIILSLGLTHSFALEDVWSYLKGASVRDVLIQAMLVAPMFEARWRWNSTRSLAVPRFSGGKKVAPQLQRIRANDLLSVVFPDQQACLENLAGAREIPEHPLVQQTVQDCMHEAMDIAGLEQVLKRVEGGHINLICCDLPEPSPLAQEILNARPYAFLDDAPLEERRTQAVLGRRWLDSETAADLGALDQEAISRVREEAWPQCRDADELHDALGLVGAMTAEEGGQAGWEPHFLELVVAGRATVGRWEGRRFWIAAERITQVQAAFPETEWDPPLTLPRELTQKAWSREDATRELVRGRLETSGPVEALWLADGLALSAARIEASLLALESEGVALRGSFSPETPALEWCDRALLARIHRYTIKRLRREIEPVTTADFMRFLFRWQHLDPAHRGHGPQGLGAILTQLEGFEAPAVAWETELLPCRLERYDPSWLDARCLSGETMWYRRSPPLNKKASVGPVRTTPIALLDRSRQRAWTPFVDTGGADELSSEARDVLERLQQTGACFFADLVAQSGLLRTRVEQALGELVARGLVTSDGFSGLRALLLPAGRSDRTRRRATAKLDHAGRWSVVVRNPLASEEAIEACARGLLRRYGVVFRKIVARERSIPTWRELLRALRRLEARGEIRGGHFIAGVSGEHFALPEAIGLLRQVRREPRNGALVALSAVDPANLVTLIGNNDTAVPNQVGNRVLYRDGVAIAVRESGQQRFLGDDLDEAEQWEANRVLLRRPGFRDIDRPTTPT